MLLISMCQILLAQEIVTYRGVILDFTVAPIELVNVVAEESETNIIASFGVTNGDGQFSLKLKKGKSYLLKTSFVGYEPLTLEIIGEANSEAPRKLTMKPSITMLEAMEVMYEFPIVISGDTITYKSDAFTDGNERKLGDILESLPGFEIDEDGQVQVQGKKIEKILIDGKEFFEGDTKMATQNIPASAVDRVQLLRNYNEVAPLNGLDDNEDRLALNIKLSEDMKNLVFGDVEAGVGLDDRYFGHSNLFFYNKKMTLNFIVDLNNIGKQAFSPRDYFRFSGGVSSMRGHSGGSINMSDNDLGFSVLENNNAQNIDNKMGSFNFNYVPNKHWNFSGFFILSESVTRISSVSNRTYINTSEENSETLETAESRASLSALAKLKTTYTPNENVHVSYEGFSKGSRLDKNALLSTNNLGEINAIDENQSQEPINTDHKLSGFFTVNAKNIFSIEGSYVYKWQNPETRFASTEGLFSSFFTEPSSDLFSLFQSRKTELHEQNSVANWYHIINSTNHLCFSVGNSFTSQNMSSDLSQTTSATRLTNDLGLEFKDVFVGVNFTFKIEKLTLKSGVALHKYNFESTQFQSENSIRKALLLPSFSATYKILSSQSISFGYSVNNTFSDIEKLSNALILRSYNTLYLGNEGLTYSQENVFNLNYYNFSLFSNLNIYGGLSYQKRKRDFTDAQEYIGLERVSSTINSRRPNERSMAYAGITKTFTKFKLDGQINLSQLKSFNSINGQANINSSRNQKYTYSGETTLFEKLTIRLSQERLYNQYESQTFASTFETVSSEVQIDWQIMNSLDLAVDYEYNQFRNKSGNTKSTYEFINASLTYQQENSPWQVKLSVMNMLNTKFIRRDSFSESLINSYTYFVQPRFSMLTLKYVL
jgi:hypothetical protein